MANHPSAAKRARQSLVRRDRNRSTMSTIRTAVKAVESAVAGKDKGAAQTSLNAAASLIQSAAGKNVMHKNTAGRKVRQLAVLVNTLG